MAGRSPEETDRLIGEAMERRDVDAVLELFEDDAVFVDMDSGRELKGHAAIRSLLSEFLAMDFSFRGGQSRVFVAGDIALVLSEWKLEMTALDGEVHLQTGTATDVMRRQADGSWRYVIDNPSGVTALVAGLQL